MSYQRFTDAFLTREQKILLSHQHNQAINCNESLPSSLVVDEDASRRAEALQSLCGFKVQSAFDRNLVLGVFKSKPQSRRKLTLKQSLYDEHSMQPMEPIVEFESAVQINVNNANKEDKKPSICQQSVGEDLHDGGNFLEVPFSNSNSSSSANRIQQVFRVISANGDTELGNSDGIKAITKRKRASKQPTTQIAIK